LLQDVFGQLLAGLKKDATRDKSMEYLRDYLAHLPIDFVMKDLESFTIKLRKLVAALMPGKKDPGAKELQLMTETITALARKHVHYCMLHITYTSYLSIYQYEHTNEENQCDGTDR
jgi:hypothetical protein